MIRPTADIPPLCRPAGWIALWRRLAQCGQLDQRIVPFPD